MRTTLRSIIAAYGSVLFASGCLSLNTYKSANNLNKGHTELAMGGGFWLDTKGEAEARNNGNRSKGLGDTMIAARHALTENFEIGGRISNLSGIYADGKFQILRQPFALSVDLEGFVASNAYFNSSDGIRGLDGALLAGFRYATLGYKYTFMNVNNISEQTENLAFPTYYFATHIPVGDIMKISPELNVVKYSLGENMIDLQYRHFKSIVGSGYALIFGLQVTFTLQ